MRFSGFESRHVDSPKVKGEGPITVEMVVGVLLGACFYSVVGVSPVLIYGCIYEIG
jgi:hypothetical protein